MDYKVVVTRDAEEDLERFIKYLIIEKESMQAAQQNRLPIAGYIPVMRSLRLCAPSGARFQRVKVPNPPGSGKDIAEGKGVHREWNLEQ